MAVQDPGRTAGFPCQQCGIVCPNMPSLLDHMEHCQQEDDRKFKCDECGRGYRHAGSLANHKKTHEVGTFECDICGKENSNALALKSHLRSHTSQKKYSCEECGKAFRLATQLATHERVHLTRREKRRSYRKVDMDCSTDDKRNETENNQPHFHSKYSDSVGVSIKNSPSEQKVDVISNTQSETDDDLNRPFKCDVCEKSYIHFRSLANHKKTHQMGMFECKMCFKQFSTMAGLYNHQRTHKSGDGADHCSQDEPYSNTPQDQFSPQSQDPSVNFCHLCQVLFTNDEEFQEHIQMHNSSSLTFGLQDTMSENPNVSYDNSIASPESNFYESPVNNIPSVSSVDDHGAFDHSPEKMRSNGHVYSDCSNNQTPSSNTIQRESQIKDINTPSENTGNANEIEDGSNIDSNERPFKCNICGKSYRHSGSLINHKRSHQVGIYQCSICRKNYPHLAALKSHLRLHKAHSSSFNLNGEGDWLSSEPLTLENQQGYFSPQNDMEEEAEVVKEEEEEEEVDTMFGMNEENGVDHSNGARYHEQFNQDFSQDMTVHLPQNEHLMQRHMCADCGETFADIVGIKSHSCPLLQQQHNSTIRGYENSLSYQASDTNCAIGNPGSNIEFHSRNHSDNQTYFEQKFHDNMSRDQRNGEGGDNTDDEDDDGDLFQCSICGNNYTSMRALRSHLRGHTQSQGTPPSSGPSSMSSHEDVKDEEQGEMMICSTCGESFANRQDLIIHQLLHNDNQVDDVNHSHMDSDVPDSKAEVQNTICGTCGIFCTSYHHLKNHGCSAERNEEMMQSKEEMKVNLVAPYEDTNPVRETIQNTKNRQYKCDQCGRSYRHPGSLLNHKKSHKTGVFRCLVCQKRFYNLLALKNHQRSHFDIKRHTCHECGKAFKIQKQLLNHLRRHKENQAKIQELNTQIQALMQMNRSRSDRGMQPLTSNANQAFTHTQRTKRPPEEKERQIKVETSEKPEDTGDQRPFSCDQCGRSYRHAGSLVNHKNSHKTGEYYCSVCNNSYSNQLAMKNHMRTHFALKRHCCQTCGKGFRGKKLLLAHVCAGPRKDGARGRRVRKSRAIRCKACKKAFVSGDQLAAHICEGPSGSLAAQSNKEERPFTCNICNRSYRHAGSLLNHKNTHKTGHFSCTFCSKPFTNPMALRNHTRIHTQKKKYVCLTCGKAFRLASILHNHQRVHNRAGSHLSCPTCGKSFQGRSGMKRHRCCRAQGNVARSGAQQPEKGDKCFTCDLCGRSYHHAGSLLNHKKTHSENLHHCTLCLQTFPDALTLQIHSQMRRHCCPECGKTFCLVSHLQSHMEVHAKDRVVFCSLCKQSFPSASSYQEHHNMHHATPDHYQQGMNEQVHNNLCWDSGANRSLGIAGMQHEVPPPLSHITGNIAEPQKSNDDASANEEKSHVCEHCGRTYRHAGSLLNHKNSHKTGSYFCTICQKEFSNLMALKNHRRIHTEPKRYQCLDCGKAFRVSTQLICHRRIHTKEKPFACVLCDKSFSSKSNLRHHQKMHQSSQTYDSSFSMDDNEFMDLDMGSFL